MLRGYQASWLRGDILAGLTVAAYLVPQVMAYATVAGLHPVAGLCGVPALVIYALLGSSPSLSLGPEATTALMTAIAIGPLAAGNPAWYAALAATLALLAGVMAAAAGTLRLGFLADLLSRPVLVGYMAGVALIMIAGQLGPATGVAIRGEAFAGADSPHSPVTSATPAWPRLWRSLQFRPRCCCSCFLLRTRWPRGRGPLLAVLLAAAAAAGLGPAAARRPGSRNGPGRPAPAPAVPSLQQATGWAS